MGLRPGVLAAAAVPVLLAVAAAPAVAAATTTAAIPGATSTSSGPPPTLAFRLQDKAIAESSGLAVSSFTDSFVLTHNDSGGKAEYFVIDSRSGKTLERVPVTGANNVDWEDIAVAGHTVYLADIGDNRAQRPSVSIYAVDEVRSERSPPAAVKTVLTYEDGPRDAEALLVSPDGNTRYVVTKQILGAGVYRVDGARLRRVGSLSQGLVTGGSWSPDGSRIALVTYAGIWVYDAAAWPGGTPERLPLPPLEQAESITWNGDDALLVGSEGVHAPVYRFDLSPPVAAEPSTNPSATTAPTTAEPSTTTPATSGPATIGPATTQVSRPPAAPAPGPGGNSGRATGWAVAAVAIVFGTIAAARSRRRRGGGLG